MKAKAIITPDSATAELEASEQEVSSFLKKVVPEAVRQGGGILLDNVIFWRWHNRIELIKKAKQIAENSGLEPQEVPLKVLEPILSNGSLELEEDIQRKWANLLANAAVGQTEITPSYPEILKQLSALEVSILDTVYLASLTEQDTKKRSQTQFAKDKICAHFSLSEGNFDVIAHNLFRLGVAQPPGSDGLKFGEARVALNTTSHFELTPLGVAFIKACREPQK